MPSQQELDGVYMGAARLHAGLSKGIRAKVGACLVTSTGLIIPGYNGLPTALGNDLEYVEEDTGELLTKPAVIHAELNAVMKAAKEGISCLGSTCYVTLAPCEQCSSMLVQVGVTEVIFDEYYRETKGLDILRQSGVKYRCLLIN